jgi:hypothetical protein
MVNISTYIIKCSITFGHKIFLFSLQILHVNCNNVIIQSPLLNLHYVSNSWKDDQEYWGLVAGKGGLERRGHTPLLRTIPAFAWMDLWKPRKPKSG